MDIKEFFRLTGGSSIAAFAEAQGLLFRQNPALQDYFLPLQLNHGRSAPAKAPARSLARNMINLAEIGRYEIARRLGSPRYKVDVLFCPTPYFGRRTENRLLLRTLKALAETDASILCLLYGSPPLRAEIEAELKAAGRSGQVTLLDPAVIANRFARGYFPRVARIRGNAAFDEIVQVLQPRGLAPPLNSHSAFINTALFVEAWNYLEPWIEFEAVVTRCHWYELCSPVCRTARQRGKPVLTFQQGVIGHSLDVPVTASKYVAFGSSSAAFLERMHRSFFQSVGKEAPAVEFIPGGSLFDTVLNLPDQFSKHTLLIIDEPVGAEDYYGIRPQRDAILKLAEQILKAATPPRVIIRPHPFWDTSGLDVWKEIARQHPKLCEISHVAWTLEDDLNRSSVVVGISSGALTVAAASGLPTFFMDTQPGFATGDLGCFRDGQTLPSEVAFRQISRVLSDATAYAQAREVTLRNAREYYANGTNLDLRAEFFKKHLCL